MHNFSGEEKNCQKLINLEEILDVFKDKNCVVYNTVMGYYSF